MPVPQPLQSRLIGALFVERGLVSDSQVRVALEIQRETGQQLGQILVDRFGVSRKELASVVAQQWAKLGGSAGPEDNASWRRLGEIFVERGFVTQEELDGALERQRQTGERLGEALVAQGVISKFELAGALAEQMASLGETDASEEAVAEQAEATVHHLPIALDPSQIPYGAIEVFEDLAIDEVEPTVPVELVVAAAEEPETVEPALEDLEPCAPVELVVAAGEELVETLDEEDEPVPPVEPVAEGAEEPEALLTETGDERAEQVAPVEPVAWGWEESTELVGEPEPDDVGVEPSADPFPEPTELLVLHGHPGSNGDGAGAAEDAMSAIACLAFAPTTTGYRLLGLDAVPAPGETVDIPDVGEYLVLRIGSTPVPHDGRVCVFLEERVTPALVETLSS